MARVNESCRRFRVLDIMHAGRCSEININYGRVEVLR
jgi:hypothetical protein